MSGVVELSSRGSSGVVTDLLEASSKVTLRRFLGIALSSPSVLFLRFVFKQLRSSFSFLLAELSLPPKRVLPSFSNPLLRCPNLLFGGITSSSMAG